MNKNILNFLPIPALILSLVACEDNNQNTDSPSNSQFPSIFTVASDSNLTTPETSTSKTTKENDVATEIKIKITTGDQEVFATLEDNATSRALVKMFPVTLPMLDLYNREMCYRFSDELPIDNLRTDGYEIGDLAYWPPRHSFVIMYKQNGEEFERQHIGHIDSGVEIFNGIGDIKVTFELLN